MFNKIKKAVLTVLCAVLIFTAFGCGGTKTSVPNTTSDIEIWLWEAGNGKEYMENIAAAFEVKYPQYNVVIKTTTDQNFIDSKLQTYDQELNTADILMSVFSGHIQKNCVTLDDVLASTADGDSMTLAEKFGALGKQLAFSDGHYYELPHTSGWAGIAYNADVINGSDYKVPNTTDELCALVTELVDDSKVPFIHSVERGYWDYAYLVWMAQYYGVENLWDLISNPTLAEMTSEGNGLHQALSVMEQCINSPKKCYNGSNSLNFTDAQTLFLEGEAVMMATGSWMEYEMKNNYEPGTKNYLIMTTPVVSSIKDKCTTIETDEELSYLISAIDKGKTDLSGTGYSVNAADYKTVADARSVMYNNAGGHAACIPAISNAIEGAKEFLKYYYSDEAMLIYADTLHSLLPISFSKETTVDTSDWSAWAKKSYTFNLTKTPIMEATRNQHAIYTAGASIKGGTDPVLLLSATNPSDRLTADALWSRIVDYHTKNWTKYFSDCGLTPPEE